MRSGWRKGFVRSWIVLAPIWALGGLGLAATIGLQERADGRRQAQVAVQSLAEQASDLPGIAFGTAGHALTQTQVKAELVRAERQFTDSVQKLGSVMHDPVATRIHAESGPYFDKVGQALLLVAAGRLGQASAVFGRIDRPGGAEYRLKQVLADTMAKYHREAQSALLWSYLGAAAAVAILLLAFTLVLTRAVFARRTAERLSGENQRLFEHSLEQAMTDPLTGLPNRRRLMLNGEEQVAAATAENPLLLVMFDLDGFKNYNDTFGHPAGDALLIRLGDRLRKAVGAGATAYRMGGDEFCVLAQAGSRESLVEQAADALRDEGEWFSISSSYGPVVIPAEAATLSEALHLADQRLYAQKTSSRRSPAVQARDSLIQVLTERDPDLGMHVSAVAGMAARTACRLGLNEADIERVRLAAELHDIGKAAVPEAILAKPGALNDEEWDFMRRHTLIGERILAAAPALATIAPLVRSSHERMDGTGYPDGLKGEDIPIGARIVAVADSFDAMVSDRAYRQALPTIDAIAELRRCAGTQFDTTVVEAFISVIEETTDQVQAA
jgi:diguanylate cyclase (GGDEF)-like protein